ncbi:hypothetical protein PsalN5692_01714 [Piscirickettsia salmonis]|uniref:hypothetical protein n=1 Tax=Piscirickettsia salmonis TaxID=1238 RepID=UPI0012B7BFDE|nr:hypothetical protein [Piscirickettsia salmonis]QGP50252.1 hypothetical protein PsalN5692_01714 [Piscirickettsia salmonis]
MNVEEFLRKHIEQLRNYADNKKPGTPAKDDSRSLQVSRRLHANEVADELVRVLNNIRLIPITRSEREVKFLQLVAIVPILAKSNGYISTAEVRGLRPLKSLRAILMSLEADCRFFNKKVNHRHRQTYQQQLQQQEIDKYQVTTTVRSALEAEETVTDEHIAEPDTDEYGL